MRWAVIVWKGRGVPGVVLGGYRSLERAEKDAEKLLGTVVPQLPAGASRRDVDKAAIEGTVG